MEKSKGAFAWNYKIVSNYIISNILNLTLNLNKIICIKITFFYFQFLNK